MRAVKIWLLSGLAAAAALAAPGCGGDGDDDGGDQPGLIAGGGANGGAIAGKLAVFVIDEDSNAPLSGATVRVGVNASAAPTAMGTTDATGGVSLVSDLLAGKQTVTVLATGYAPSTWVGINAANLTIPVRSKAPPAVTPSGTVMATIAGWDALPMPATNHFTAAIVVASEAPDHDSVGITQGTRMVSGLPMPIAANICIKGMVQTIAISDCNLSIKTRAGKQALLAFIVDRDNRGTATDNDDVSVVTGYAVVTGLDVASGATMGGVMLAQIPAADTTQLAITLSPPPAPLTTSRAVPVLDLGTDGRISLGFVLADAATPMSLVPKLVGPLSAAHYDVTAQALAPDPSNAQSLALQRNVALGAGVNVTSWLAPPSQLTANPGLLAFGFTASTGASVHAMNILAPAVGGASSVWRLTFFDGTTAVTLPALTPDPFPAGGAPLRLEATAIDVPGLNLQRFQSEVAADTVARLGSDALSFTR
ncbi:MAG: carboxypeptidase regulatory-like domain-containing protein [Deltaproteobacteria bacterium]|nr:carboxypeptidase regulatory-like domain-containing protein [Deltaproteobacteria bacterium]